MQELTDIQRCPNCGYLPFETNFCPECGQRKLTEKDDRLWSLAGDFFEGVFNLENSFFRTIKTMFSRPNIYAKEYDLGARKKYISPIKLFLFANALYFLFPAINAFTTTLNIQLNGLIYSEYISGFVENRVQASGLGFNEFESQYNQLTSTLSKVLLITLPFLLSLVTWASTLFQKNKPPFLYHLNRSFVFHAFVLSILVSLLPGSLYLIALAFSFESLLGILNNFTITLTSVVLMNLFGYLLYRGFFKTNIWISLIRTAALNVVYFLLIFLYRFILLMVTLGWIAAFR